MARNRMILIAAALAVSCTASLAHAQDDTVICRGPGFYQTHSGSEKSEKDAPNIAQEIINEAGGIEVCGHFLTQTDDIGGLDSALEGLCVRTQGELIRQLYRQLITTALNCLMSEGDCDDIVGGLTDVTYSACNDRCGGQWQGDEPPSIEECIENLDCFNNGGEMIEGECVVGTCDDDGLTNCEDDSDCEDELECVPFEDSCANNDFCSEELDSPVQICPKSGPASSPKICKVARRNGCTVDDIACYQGCSDYEPCVEACEATPDCDPSIACQNEGTCFEQCLFSGFGDGTPCGCEYAWSVYCGVLYPSDWDLFFGCLYEYEIAEAYGFCTECEADPAACAAP